MRASKIPLRSLPSTIRSVLARGAAPSTSDSNGSESGPTSAGPSTDSALAPHLHAPGSPGHAENSAPSAVHGWLRSVRAHKNVAFLEVDDGTARVQAVLKGKGRAEGLTAGSGVRLTGQLEPSRGQGQEMEFAIRDMEVLGGCDPETYPIQKKTLPLPYLRDHAHLRFRTAHTAAVMRARDGLMRDWHDWFEDNDFVHIHTPLLTSSDCEGAGETFKLQDPVIQHHNSTSLQPPEPFFPHPVNLTVSSQLHLEAPTHALARTYTLSPAFRAEPSLTSRHLSEFYMLEGEVAFTPSLSALLDTVEAGLRSVAHTLMWSPRPRHVRLRSDLEVIRDAMDQADAETDFEARGDRAPLAHLINLAARPFARMTYTEAVEICRENHAEAGFAREARWGEGLGTEHEKWLAGRADGPVFVTHYPKALKPFYMLPSSADADADADASAGADEAQAQGQGETVTCFDLLFPGIGELVGGSLREHRTDELLARMREAGLDEQAYKWYVDLRRYGGMPHGGWGMGFERWVSWVTGVGNVRDVVAFPRWRGNCRY